MIPTDSIVADTIILATDTVTKEHKRYELTLQAGHLQVERNDFMEPITICG